MTEWTPDGLARSRVLARNLRALGREPAPPTLFPAVLVEIGIADGFWPVETPIGAAFVAHNPVGISAVAVGDDPEAFAAAHLVRTGRAAYLVPPPPRLAVAVRRRLDGGGCAGLRFDLRSRSPFDRAVLGKVMDIPRGEVRPYAWVAREIGRPGAARAVGGALARNPAPILIPCHRVVRGSGAHGDYVFGGEAKRLLLVAEGAASDDPSASRTSPRFVGSDTTGIFCYPTCRNARRITPRHRVSFASVAAAVADGYRPCKVCRPVVAA